MQLGGQDLKPLCDLALHFRIVFRIARHKRPPDSQGYLVAGLRLTVRGFDVNDAIQWDGPAAENTPSRP